MLSWWKGGFGLPKIAWDVNIPLFLYHYFHKHDTDHSFCPGQETEEQSILAQICK
jgi:hypothetical protein